MKIYAACLSSYNNGILYGKWIDVAGAMVDEIRDSIKEMLEKSPMADADEYAIHDYDDMPNLGEYPGLEYISIYSQLVERAGQDGYKPEEVRAVVDHFCGSVDDAEAALENAYGVWDRFQDYANDRASEILSCESQDSFAAHYFDYEAYARDLLANEFMTIDVPRGVLVIANW